MQKPATNPSAVPLPDPSRWVDEHGDALFRYAILRLKDEHLAEDLIQDTFLAALNGIGKFKPGSSPRAWLVGILKRKIIDHYRRNVIEIPSADLKPWDERTTESTSTGTTTGRSR